MKVCEKSRARTPAQIPWGFSPSMVPQPEANRGSQPHRGSGAQKMMPGQGGGHPDCGEMLSSRTSRQGRSREMVTKALAGRRCLSEGERRERRQLAAGGPQAKRIGEKP